MKFSKQVVYCRTCGTQMETDFSKGEGEFCSLECAKEFQWRHVLSTLGRPYRRAKEEVAKEGVCEHRTEG